MEKALRDIRIELAIVLSVEDSKERDQTVSILAPNFGKCRFLAKNSRSSTRFGDSLTPGVIASFRLTRLQDYWGFGVEGEVKYRHHFERYEQVVRAIKMLKSVDGEILLGGGQEIFSLLESFVHEWKNEEEFWKEFHRLLGNE